MNMNEQFTELDGWQESFLSPIIMEVENGHS